MIPLPWKKKDKLFNEPIYVLIKVIKVVLAPEVEVECGGLYSNTQNVVPLIIT